MAELLPCKCGKVPVLIEHYSNGTRRFSYWCPKCDTERVYCFTKESAKNEWNTRTPKERGGEK